MDIPAGFLELTEATGFTAANGPWFEKVEGNRVWRGFMPGPQHANALGIVHGGMMAAFIDAALGSVVYHAIDRRCVTLKLTLDYLTPARSWTFQVCKHPFSLKKANRNPVGFSVHRS